MTRFPVSAGLLRSCRWRLHTRSVIVLLCYGMFWWMWASIVLCLVMFTWPVEAIANHGKPRRPVYAHQPVYGQAGLVNAQANLTRARTEAMVRRPIWCWHCHRWSPASASSCAHCGSPALRRV